MAIRRIHGEGTHTEAEIHETDKRSLRGLFSELGDEISTLFRQEIALARAETGEKVAQARSGATQMAVGAVLAFAGLFVLLMAGVYALSDIMHPGWAALIVGAAAALIGYAVLKSGSNNLKARNLVPERTTESLKRDADMAKRRVQ